MSEFGGLWKHEETQHALQKKWHNSQLVDCGHYTEEEGRWVFPIACATGPRRLGVGLGVDKKYLLFPACCTVVGPVAQTNSLVRLLMHGQQLHTCCRRGRELTQDYLFRNDFLWKSTIIPNSSSSTPHISK